MKAAGAAFAAALTPGRLHAIEQADAVFATAYQVKDGPAASPCFRKSASCCSPRRCPIAAMT